MGMFEVIGWGWFGSGCPIVSGKRAEGEIRIIIRCVRCLGPKRVFGGVCRLAVEADALVPSAPW